MMTVLVVLGAFAGLVILVRVAATLGRRWAQRKLSTLGFCECCFHERAVFLANIDDGAPIGVCDACRAKKLGPIATEWLLADGRLVRIENQKG